MKKPMVTMSPEGRFRMTRVTMLPCHAGEIASVSCLMRKVLRAGLFCMAVTAFAKLAYDAYLIHVLFVTFFLYY